MITQYLLTRFLSIYYGSNQIPSHSLLQSLVLLFLILIQLTHIVLITRGSNTLKQIVWNVVAHRYLWRKTEIVPVCSLADGARPLMKLQLLLEPKGIRSEALRHFWH